MIIDANVLIYASDENATHFAEASSWLDGALRGTERVGFPWICLLAFQRITTNPALFAMPLTPSRASDYIENWLKHPNSWVPQPGPQHASILRTLTVDSGARGTLVTDAHLAALAIEHGTSICSFDSDFARFQGLRWFSPLDAQDT